MIPGAGERVPWGGPLPRDVPGFAQAMAAGLVPVVPRTPPAPVPGRSANRRFKAFLGKVAATILAVILATRIAMAVHQTWLDLAVIGLGFASFALMLRWLAGVGRCNFAEHERGYTTLVLRFGMFSAAGDLRWRITKWRIPWDYSGLWVLRDDGTVISAPAWDREPPGFYPSPHRPARFELWTGCAWTHQYR